MIIGLVLLSAIVRFYKIGVLPAGASVAEIQLGSNLALVRLPFAILGLTSIGLFYILLKKIFNNSILALVGSTIFAFSPWHIQVSRIFSPELIYLNLLLGFAIYAGDKEKLIKIVSLVLALALSVQVLFTIVLHRDPKVTDMVINERNKGAWRLFANKYVIAARLAQNKLFDNLDIGNLFFSGHPRERWGHEEMAKLPFALIPFIAIGLLHSSKKLFGLYTLFFLASLKIEFLFIVPLVMLSSLGFNNSKSAIKIVCSVFIVIEVALFIKNYYRGLTESIFSPRYSLYNTLRPQVLTLSKAGETFAISDRIPHHQVFLSVARSDKPSIFVDALPDDPSPIEPLFKKNGQWPTNITPLWETYDSKTRQTIIIYRQK